MVSKKLYATFLVAFFIFLQQVYGDSDIIISRDLTRFIFRYYYILPYNDFLNSVINKMEEDFPGFDSSVLFYSVKDYSSSGPGNLVRLLEKNIIQQGLQVREYTDTSPIEFRNDTDLYLLFISDTSSKAESSFGHISLLLKSASNIYFDTVITFLASDFTDYNTGKHSISKYLKGAFSEIDGEIVYYPFFDLLYKSIIEEGRMVICYRINISREEKKALVNSLWESIDNHYSYNFFTENCSTFIFDKLLNVSGRENMRLEFTPPVIVLRELCNNKLLEYDGAFYNKGISKTVAIEYDNKEKFDLSKSTYYRTSNFYYLKDGAAVEFCFFNFSRPFDGLLSQTANIFVGNITFDKVDSDLSISEIVPVEFYFRPSIYKSLGGLFDLSVNYNYTDDLFIRQKYGLFFDIGSFRFEGYYKYTSNHYSDDNFKFRLLFSNSAVDIFCIWDLRDHPYFKEIGGSFQVKNNMYVFANLQNDSYQLGVTILW
jgi:hypothetical protein